MTDKELNIALREMARSVGLCDEWYNAWSDDDTIDMCIERFIKGFDFSVDKDWPTLDFIRKNIRKEDLHRHNIYLDEKVDIKGKNGYYVFLGDCSGLIVFSGFVAATVYMRHRSNVDIAAEDGARVFVSYYDKSRGIANYDEWSTIKLYKHQKQ